MKFTNLGPVDEWTLTGYGDAGYKNLPDKISSCGGQLVMVSNKRKQLDCVISWRSRKLKRVVSSSTAAEALATNDTLDEMVYIKQLLKELFGTVADNIPLELVTDSRNLHRSVLSTTMIDNPRVRTDIAKVKESLKSGELAKFLKVGGQDMLADCLTKKGASPQKLLKLIWTCKL